MWRSAVSKADIGEVEVLSQGVDETGDGAWARSGRPRALDDSRDQSQEFVAITALPGEQKESVSRLMSEHAVAGLEADALLRGMRPARAAGDPSS